MQPTEGYKIYSPESNVNLGNVTATGNIEVNAKGGTVGNLTSTEASVRVSTSDSITTGDMVAKGDVSVRVIDQSVSPSLLAILEQMTHPTRGNFQFTPASTTVVFASSSASSSAEPVEQNEETVALGTVVGRIMRCTCCGFNSSRFTGSIKLGQMSTSTREISFSDPAKNRYTITENGIYEIKYAGNGKLDVDKVKDSIH